MAEVVGREAELDAIQQWLERPLPSALLIEGEAGIGKTTLWREGVTRAHARGFTVLCSSPCQPEQGLAFAGLADLLGPSMAALAALLPEPQLHALRVALRIDDPGDPPIDASTIAFATLGSIQSLAGRAPTLVAVDDVQWLDRPTGDAVAFALRRLGSSDVHVLVARRREPGAFAPPSLEDALAEMEPEVVEVGPLSQGAVQRIVSERTGTGLPRPVLHRVHEASAGNPLFALELTRALGGSPRPAPGEPLPVPAALRALIGRRLAALPRSTEEALQVASLLAEPTTTLVTAVSGHEQVDLEPAVDAGIVELHDGVVRFTHPLLASGLADRLSAAERRELHRTLASRIESVEERASHLLAATSAPDPETAARIEDAAASARARGASAVAADLLEGVLTITDRADVEARHRRSIAASEAFRDAGDWKRAEIHAQAAVDLVPSGPRRAEALMALGAANASLQAESVREALAHARGDPRLETRAHLLEAHTLFHADAPKAVEASRQALVVSSRCDDPVLRAAALATLGYMAAATLDDEAGMRIDEAAGLEQAGALVETDFSPLRTLATVQMWRDEHDEARASFSTLTNAAVARGDMYGTMIADSHVAAIDWRAGHWPAALDLAEKVTAMWETSADADVASTVLYLRALVLAHLGRVDDALADIERTRALAAPGRLMAARLGWLEGHIALGTGDAAQARSLLVESSSAFDEIGLLHPGLRLYLSDAIEASVGTEDFDAAAGLAERLVALGRMHDLPRATAIGLRGRGLLLAAKGDLEEAECALEGAVSALEGWSVPFEHARTWLALGGVQRRLRRRRAARESLDRALTLFDQLGATLWTTRARAELARIGGRAPAPDGLTATERRVAELVAEGKSNKEVAAGLVISVHTVEAALTSIYRKLHVHSRTEMARKLVPGSKD